MRLFEILFFIIYRFVIWPILIVCVLIAKRWNRKLAHAYDIRNSRKDIPAFDRRPIWIHASSGEFEYARPIIRQIKEADPSQPIVVTFFSPSYASTIASTAGVDWSAPLPLDLPGPVGTFFRKLNPKALLISRTDIWPEVIRQARINRIPSLLFSATVRPAGRLHFFKRLYRKWLWTQLTRIFVVSLTDQERLAADGIHNVDVKGDTRFDQVFYRLQHPKELKPIFRAPGDLILVAGSTWPDDEIALLPAIAGLLRDNVIRLILAPHETDERHLAKLKDQLESLNLKYELYSQISEWRRDILIIDRVGILADVYPNGDIAFVGGSFRQKVHSVMEPLAAGLITLVGPYHLNNREACDFQDIAISNGRHAVTAVNNSDEIQTFVRAAASQAENLPKDRQVIRNAALSRTGCSQHVLQWLKTAANKND